MAMTPEKKVKKKVARQLEDLGCYYFYPATGGYGRSGVPDIVGCYKGKFFGFECKAGKNEPTPLQQKNLLHILMNGGVSEVINEDNAHKVKDILDGLYDKPELEL
jgi:Holliday junction resolvase